MRHKDNRVPVQAPEPVALVSEARWRLQQYLQIDTTNPPGNELAAARLLGSWLEAEGIPATIFQPAPGRANLVARLEGSGHSAPLLLLHHMDVVPADPARWTHPPFSGIEAEGAIWGRGALDMKSLGIMQLIARAAHEVAHGAQYAAGATVAGAGLAVSGVGDVITTAGVLTQAAGDGLVNVGEMMFPDSHETSQPHEPSRHHDPAPQPVPGPQPAPNPRR